MTNLVLSLNLVYSVMQAYGLTRYGHHYKLRGALAVSWLGGGALQLSCDILGHGCGSRRRRGQNSFLLTCGRGLRSGRLWRLGRRRALYVGGVLRCGGTSGFLRGWACLHAASLRLGGLKVLGGVAWGCHDNGRLNPTVNNNGKHGLSDVGSLKMYNIYVYNVVLK